LTNAVVWRFAAGADSGAGYGRLWRATDSAWPWRRSPGRDRGEADRVHAVLLTLSRYGTAILVGAAWMRWGRASCPGRRRWSATRRRARSPLFSKCLLRTARTGRLPACAPGARRVKESASAGRNRPRRCSAQSITSRVNSYQRPHGPTGMCAGLVGRPRAKSIGYQPHRAQHRLRGPSRATRRPLRAQATHLCL